MSEAARRTVDSSAINGDPTTMAKEIAAQLRADPQHHDRIRRLRVALESLEQDGRLHDLEEIAHALDHHGL